MNSLWIDFQSSAGSIFAKLYSLAPGSDYLKLLLISTFSGLVLVWLYRFVSFQKKIRTLKQKIFTLALEPFVFSDSIRISLLTPLKLIILSLKYLGLSLPPLLILAAPVIWLLGLLNQVVGYRELDIGEQILVSIKTESSRDLRKLELSVNSDNLLLTELVRSYPDSRAWAGLEVKEKVFKDNSLLLKVAGENTEIPLYGKPVLPVLSTSFWERLFYPGARVNISAGLEEVSLEFPVKSYNFLGYETSWVIIFLIISMLSGLIFARIFKIQI